MVTKREDIIKNYLKKNFIFDSCGLISLIYNEYDLE